MMATLCLHLTEGRDEVSCDTVSEDRMTFLVRNVQSWERCLWLVEIGFNPAKSCFGCSSTMHSFPELRSRIVVFLEDEEDDGDPAPNVLNTLGTAME